MKIVVHCKNIDWDTDGEKVDLPKKCDVKLDLETDVIHDGLGIDSWLEDYLVDWLSDAHKFCINNLKYRFRINSLKYTWEYDFDDIQKLFFKGLKKRYQDYCKKTGQKNYELEEWISESNSWVKMLSKVSKSS